MHVPSQFYMIKNANIDDITFDRDDSDNHEISPAKCLLLVTSSEFTHPESVCQHSGPELAGCEKNECR